MMGRLEQKHWGLIVSFLTATATLIGSLQHWGDISPLFVAALLGQVATLLGALFVGAPPNPHTRHTRRHNDRVSDITRHRHE
jgi:hypothetical protein